MKPEYIKPELSVEELSKALFESNKRLSESNKNLKESEFQRRQLLENLSHDLRSPISSISAIAEFLTSLDSYDKNELNHHLSVIQEKALHLNTLMSDLLMLTTLDHLSPTVIDFQKIPICSFVEDYFYGIYVDANSKDRNLSLSIPENNLSLVNIDPNLMIRVFDNLFSNALKFTSEGDSISITVILAESKVEVIVADSGIGIRAAYLNQIFDRSFMASSARTISSKKGFGLGLSIVQDIITSHSGTISCTSELGIGSSFHIQLPLITK